MPDYIQNLFQLASLVSDEGTVQKFRDDFNRASIRYGDMKKALAEDMVRFIAPIRERAEAIYADKAFLKKVLDGGAEKARDHAQQTITQVRHHVGLNYL